MEKESINSLLVVLMLVAVGGFAILSDNGSNSDSSSEDGENQQMEDEWDVYYVESGDDLPNCNSDTLGRLYYVASTTTFEVCLTSGWSFIDIKGADGEQGPPGEQGPAGADGANGTNGINGQDGTNGQDGSASPNTMLTSISDTDSTVQCIAGGRIIVHGLDNGDEGGVSQNGILEPGEIDYTTSYCSNFVVSRISDVIIATIQPMIPIIIAEIESTELQLAVIATKPAKAPLSIIIISVLPPNKRVNTAPVTTPADPAK